MQLSEWLRSTKTAQAALARRIGVTQGRISQIAAEGTDSLSTAALIEEVTKGAVTMREVMRSARAS
jgi:DNA-binding transcriptional regulator YdaS (Cro superfamily)